MKPFLMASVLVLALTGAGCTAADKTDADKPAADKTAADNTGGAGRTPTPAPSAADAALSQDTRAICAQADRTGTTFGATLVADLKVQLDARSKGSEAQAEAKRKLKQDVSNYSYALADMSKLAGDPTLKGTLKQMSDQVTGFSGDLSKLDASKLSALSDTLGKACGKG